MKAIGKRIIAGVFGVAAVGCGILGFGYSKMALSDIGRIGVPLWSALLGNVLFWLLTVGAFALVADLIKFATSGRPFQVPPGVRALGLGLLSFFPGFLIALLITGGYEAPQHPNDSQAFIPVFVVSLVFGCASVLAVTVYLLKKSHR